MTNNEPEFEKPGAIPVQLCFFYDPLTRKLPFSSSSPDSFFETTLDLRQDPPFLEAFEEMDTDFLITEWRSCLQLKENEKRNFTMATGKSKNQLNFSFTVMRPAASLLSHSSLLVISVTRTITNSIFQQQNKTLSSFNKEYAEFIELAAHDLDSPLRKLSMLVERMTSKYDITMDKDTQGYVLRARACLSDMRSLIENLSLLGRLSSSTGKKNTCNLDSIIQMALKDLEGLSGEENVKVSTGALPVVQGDNAQYKQLFRSLLENSFKFRKKDMPAEIEIMSEAATGNEKQVHGLFFNNSYCKITIADKGIGFRQEYAEKIFQPFVRLNGKSEYPGSGIGLALCKKIVENHGGIIYAEGDENIGARFTLFLPLSPD